jgi:hypothetical protein
MRRKLFAAVVTAIQVGANGTEFKFVGFSLIADDEADAEKDALHVARLTWPIAEGWTEHRALATCVGEAQVTSYQRAYG